MKPASGTALTAAGGWMLVSGPPDSGKITMTADGESVTKHAPLLPVQQRLEALHFDSHEEARVMIDPGVQAF
jgi:hypothetical protein